MVRSLNSKRSTPTESLLSRFVLFNVSRMPYLNLRKDSSLLATINKRSYLLQGREDSITRLVWSAKKNKKSLKRHLLTTTNNSRKFLLKSAFLARKSTGMHDILQRYRGIWTIRNHLPRVSVPIV